jgi:hypothetical protein
MNAKKWPHQVRLLDRVVNVLNAKEPRFMKSVSAGFTDVQGNKADPLDEVIVVLENKGPTYEPAAGMRGPADPHPSQTTICLSGEPFSSVKPAWLDSIDACKLVFTSRKYSPMLPGNLHGACAGRFFGATRCAGASAACRAVRKPARCKRRHGPCFRHPVGGTGKGSGPAAPAVQTRRGAVGFLAQESSLGAQHHHGKPHSRAGAATRMGRCDGLRRHGAVVGAQVGGAQGVALSAPVGGQVHRLRRAFFPYPWLRRCFASSITACRLSCKNKKSPPDFRRALQIGQAAAGCLPGIVDQRLLIGGTSRRGEPVNSWRGRPILYSGSLIISFNWAIQPTVRARAKMPVNRFTGMPMARCTMPE